MTQRIKIRLGDLLVAQKIISGEQLESALADQKTSGRKLGRILIENNYISEDRLLEFLSRQLNIPFVDLLHFKVDPEVTRIIPEIHARRFRAVALKREPDGVLVGMSDPTNIFAYDELTRLIGKPIKLAVVREADLLKTIDTVYRHTEQITGFAQELREELSESDLDLQDLAATADVADAPVVKLLQTLFDDAIQIKASDIHIEPDENVLRIRQRIDGVLQEHVLNEKRIAASLVLRLKLMASLDISEKRLPQDGRFSVKVRGRSIDVRMSTMPVQYGESVVMRLLDQSQGVLNLHELGMPDDMRRRFEHIIHRPHGMVLVTGPTGSGKTTTLYAALQLLNKQENKIITVEDPVEYRLPRINQVQVNPVIDLTFARVLRSALRQDPDIILVGEMRDEETCEIGLRAAMTGHLVLSTLHTNDAISTINRLLDMGAPGYLLAAALHAILAQRLVRKICLSCIQPAELEPQAVAWLRNNGRFDPAATAFKCGNGCHHCNNTGYAGRIGVYELLELNEAMVLALTRGDAGEFAIHAKQAPGYRSLDEVALDYAVAGMTTMDEVLRVSADIEPVSSSSAAAVTA